jgi:Iap family predicted aminopeptidase
MKREPFVFVFFFLISVFCLSQPAGQSGKLPPDFKEKAFSHVEKLASLGTRAAGSANEAQAIRYIKEIFEKTGLDTHVEPFEFETFVIDKIDLLIGREKIEPNFIVYDPYQGQTELRGEAVFFDPQTPRDKIRSLNLAGQIVITARPANPYQLAFENPRAIVYIDSEGLDRLMKSPARTVDLKIMGKSTRLKSANVVASLRPDNSSTKEIAVSAHLDSTQGPGACDNATGVGVLIELARYFKKMESQLPCRLKFIALGAEEIGMVGSRLYVSKHGQELKDCELLFNIDTVGGSQEIFVEMLGGARGIAQEKGRSQIPEQMADKAWCDSENRWRLLHRVQDIPLMASCLPDWLPAAIEESGKELGYKVVPSRQMGSDHLIFAQAGVPATDIAISGCKSHGPEDIPAQINKESLEKAGNLVARVVQKGMSRINR